VRYAGQEILGIAAASAQAAEEALKLVQVEYEERDFVINVEAAKEPTAPTVFDTKIEERRTEGDAPGSSQQVAQKGNVRGPNKNGANDAEVEKALAESDAVIEGSYSTQVQTHCPMETHGVVARWDSDDELMVWASTQGTFGVRDDMAEAFDLPKTNVRVVTKHMGGGFGAKFGAGVWGILAAKLARKANAPVRLMLDRKGEHLSAGNRPDSRQKLTIGAKKDGKLTAIKLESYGTAGVGTGAGVGGPVRATYDCQVKQWSESDVFTNAGPGAAFRAPGHPQGAFALEQMIDELAYKIGMDPLEFRKINTTSHAIRQKELEIGAEKFGWSQRNPKVAADKGPIKRGLGVANSVWYYIRGYGFQTTVQVNSDGSVEFQNGVQDIGGGITTVLAMVVAEELGIRPQDVAVNIGDTNLGSGPASGGSQTTAGITPAARNAAYLAKMRMLEIAAPMLEVKPEELSIAEGKIFVTADPSKSKTWKEVASKIRSGQFRVIGERLPDSREVNPGTIAGVQFADVSVDMETGIVKVNRVVAIHDCGRPMDRLTLESQINGGIIQGLSYALYEDRILDRNTGLMVNPNLEQYKIAGSIDMPVIESVVLDVNHGQSSTGAIGIGEPATVPTAGAIANAIYHATGVRIRQLPMTPDRILDALYSDKGGTA
jgi:xanthine dehydrogenase YagR molybdenum-binding subunit